MNSVRNINVTCKFQICQTKMPFRFVKLIRTKQFALINSAILNFYRIGPLIAHRAITALPAGKAKNVPKAEIIVISPQMRVNLFSILTILVNSNGQKLAQMANSN